MHEELRTQTLEEQIVRRPNMSKDMELFNKFTAHLLGVLFDHFPVEKDIRLEDFECLNNEENLAIFFSSIKFLKREGFINYSNTVYGGFMSVTLTAKGLTVLNSSPKSLETKEPLGKRLSSALQNSGPEILKVTVSEIIKLGLDLSRPIIT